MLKTTSRANFDAEESAAPTGKYGKLLSEEGGVRKLTGMYRNWFLDYASYVILERAVPHVQDGLKPVQRRILHAMKAVDDGRYNKVANIVGQTMQYHPHGDASIKDALVQLGPAASSAAAGTSPGRSSRSVISSLCSLIVYVLFSVSHRHRTRKPHRPTRNGGYPIARSLSTISSSIRRLPIMKPCRS